MIDLIGKTVEEVIEKLMILFPIGLMSRQSMVLSLKLLIGDKITV